VDRREAAAQGRHLVLISFDENIGPSVELRGPLAAGSLRALASRGPLHFLSVRDRAVFGLGQARELLSLPGIDALSLSCPVTRAAASLLLDVPGLRRLELFDLRAGSALRGFEAPRKLEQLYCPTCTLQPVDFEAIARSPTLRMVSADDAIVTPAAFDALMSMPRLEWLSLESCQIDDALASRLRTGTALRSLFLPLNPLTRAGLRHIVTLESLRELDLWETDITLEDLDLLAALPQLEYLSIGVGDPDGPRQTYDPDRLLPMLARLPSLQRLELDGIDLDETQRAAYAARFAELRLIPR
jgi:hypothetical protein